MPEFTFEGFEPQSDTQTLAKELLWQVEGRAPSRAAKSAGMQKTSEGFKSFIRLTTRLGVIEAEATADEPKESLKKTFERINERLDEWQKSRQSFS